MKSIRLILLFAFLQMANVAIAQDAERLTHFGVSVTPQLSLQPMGASQVPADKYGFCFNIGGDVLYDLSAAIQLKSGLYVQQNSINYRDYSPQFPSDVENGEALPYKSYYDYELNQLFIGVPLEAKIKLGKAEKANHFFISGGARFQYLFKTSGTEQIVESGHPWEEEDIDQEEFDSNSMWTLLTIGLGYEWAIGKGKLAINPVFDYALTGLDNVYEFIPDYGPVQFYGIRILYYK